VKSYTYCKVQVGGSSGNVNNPIPYAVMPLVETTTIEDTTHSIHTAHTIHKLEYEYVNDGTPGMDQGRVKTVTETVYDDQGTAHVSTTAFTYTHIALKDAGDQIARKLSVLKTFTAEDGSTSTTLSVSSMVSGREISSTDGLGVKTDYTYDVHGREKTRTVAAGSAYERTMSFDYAFEILTDTIKVPTVTTTHSSKAQEKIWYDGSMRAIKHQKYITATSMNTQTTYNAWMDASTSTYDDQGHLVATQAFDWRTKTIPLIGPKTTLHYDDWGQNDLTTYASNRVEGSAHDPVAKTTTLTWSGTGPDDVGRAARIITYNEQNQPVSVTILDKNGVSYSSTSSLYDGARRLRQFTDVLGHTISIDYDGWNRPRTFTMQPDGTVVTRTYAPFAGLELITEITAKGSGATAATSLGTRTYDGLHRVTQTTVGGRTTKYHYKDSGPVPDYTIEPDNTQLNYTYIPELGSVMHTCTGGDANLQLDYDHLGGWLISAKDASGPTLTLTYDPWGNLTSRIVAYPDRSRTESYGTSAFGRLLAFIDVGGDRTGFDFDYNSGLPASDSLGSKKAVTYTFTNGVLTSWTAGQSTVTLTMDEFVRETDRLVTRGGTTYDLQQSYYANNMLKEQKSLLGATTLRDDQYEYDNRNRVSKFTSTGTALALDPYGKSITEQDFVYDAIDNLTSVTTTFTGGTDNATYTYGNADPCQLSSVAHDGPGYPQSIPLTYDANGRMKTDDQGRTLNYDSLGRLKSIQAGGATVSYFYDGLNVRREQQLADGSSLEFYYRGHYPISVIKHTGSSS
jgi:YD repeat-containing protein